MTDHVPAPAGAWSFLVIIFLFFIFCNYSEPHSQNRLYEASFLLMWLLRHIKLHICMNASIRRMQFCMALNSYHFFKNIQNISLTYFHHCAIMDSALLCGAMLICHA